MRLLTSSLLSLVLICGCVSPRPQVPEREVALRPGDRILVQFANHPGLEVRQVVDPGGDISLPFVVKLHVAGMTLQQVRDAVVAAYQPIERPLEVSVFRCP